MKQDLMEAILHFYPECDYLSDLPMAVKTGGEKRVIRIFSFLLNDYDADGFDEIFRYLFKVDCHFNNKKEVIEKLEALFIT